MVIKSLKYLGAIVLLLCSCQKDEIPIQPLPKGDAEIYQVELGDNYENQVYFGLLDNAVISTNKKTDWDLAFESSSTGWRIILNSSKLERIHRSEIPFEETVQIPGENWLYDDITGNLDSTAVGNWKTDNYVYILDRGFDSNGVQQGYKKFEMQEVDEFSYKLRIADLNSANEEIIEVIKNPESTFTQFSFDSNQTVLVEPAQDSWDMLFTQYTEIFEQGALPYLVTGVLINREGYEVAETDSVKFSDIDLTYANQLEYSQAIDIIGYDWKEYNFDTGIYEIYSDQNFVIKHPTGRIYKLHFVDFYNDIGEKGAPQFEFEEL